MSEEHLLLIIAILLALILIVVAFALVRQVVWIKAVVDAFTERDAQSRGQYEAIGVLINNSEYDKALTEIHNRIEADGEKNALLWYLGKVLYHLKRWEESKDAIIKAIEIEPSYKVELQPYLDILSKKLDKNA